MHPYEGKPDRQFWRRAGGLDAPTTLDPVTNPRFRIAPNDAIVTAGSCFAQHIARRLEQIGYRYLVTEPAHAIISEADRTAYNYGLFSARYGNVYTARQLLQLLQRAYGAFEPIEDHWRQATGHVVDPFRPNIQPDGFSSVEELRADRRQHFAAVRAAVESADIFVFTLGLTEAWQDRRDGAIFPLAPGVAGGDYDAERHVFVNFSLDDTLADMKAAIAFLRARNPNLRLLLTVSPVPLNATFEPRHVLVSTTWSKAVLRLAAEELTRDDPLSDYFPSYEIITSPHARGRYFAADCRSVTPAGVDHVMDVFLRHFGTGLSRPAQTDAIDRDTESARHMESMTAAMRIICDEEKIDNS